MSSGSQIPPGYAKYAEKSYRENRGLVCVVEIISRLKEKGAIEPADLKEIARNLGLRDEQTCERAREALADAGIIRRRKDGKWELVKDWQEFKTPEEYRVRLEHSRWILSKTYLGDTPLIKHLETGYPEIYNNEYNNWMKARSAVAECEKELYAQIAREAREKGLEVEEYNDKLEASIKSCLELYPYDDSEQAYFERLLCIIESVIKRNITDEARALARKILDSNDVREKYKSLLEARENEIKARKVYEEKLNELKIRVENGEPLKGYCDYCPRVTIGR